MLEIVPVILAIIIINFFLINFAPGDPAVLLAGEYASTDYVEAIREKYGLNKSVPERLVTYMTNFLQGDLGYSYFYGRDVLSIILERIPATLLLFIPSQIISLGIGTLLGAYAARKYLKKTDATLSTTILTLYSIPMFWAGILLIIIFGLHLNWFPTGGMITIGASNEGFNHYFDVLWHMILPVVTLTLWFLPQYFRIARSSVVEVMGEDFITTFRAVGETENRIFIRHALRNALLPTLSVAGLYWGLMLMGSVVTETVFVWPGLGRLTIEALLQRDYPLLMGIFLIASCIVVVANMITDFLYAAVDPRVRYR